MRSNMRAFIHAAAVLAEKPGLTIAQLMRAAHRSSGIAQRVIAEVSEPAVILAMPVAVRDGASSAPAGAAPEMRHGDRHGIIKAGAEVP